MQVAAAWCGTLTAQPAQQGVQHGSAHWESAGWQGVLLLQVGSRCSQQQAVAHCEGARWQQYSRGTLTARDGGFTSQQMDPTHWETAGWQGRPLAQATGPTEGRRRSGGAAGALQSVCLPLG